LLIPHVVVDTARNLFGALPARLFGAPLLRRCVESLTVRAPSSIREPHSGQYVARTCTTGAPLLISGAILEHC
jgi:hypothetical protein